MTNENHVMMRPHILIFEPEANGHQMNFVRYMLDGIATLGTTPRITLLTTEDAAGHINCRKLVSDFSESLTIRIVTPVIKGSRLFRSLSAFAERQWRFAEAFIQGFAEIGPQDVDFVLIPSLESIGLWQLALRRRLFRGKPWATVANAIRFHHKLSGVEGPTRAIDVLQRGLFSQVVRDPDLVCFGTNDPYLPRAVHHRNVVFCPDPCTPPGLSGMATARVAYGIGPEACVILVFGFIDRRKCVDVLLEGVARVAPDSALTILLAGAQHPGHLGPIMAGTAARKLRDQGRLVEANRFIDFSQEIDPMSVADIVWVFYERDFVRNSNVLALAGLARKPVIARRQGLVGRQVEEHELGLALQSASPDEVAAALTQLARDPAMRRRMGDNGARAFAENTPENFARPVVNAIGEALQAPDR